MIPPKRLSEVKGWIAELADLGVYYAREHGLRVVGDADFASWFRKYKSFD